MDVAPSGSRAATVRAETSIVVERAGGVRARMVSFADLPEPLEHIALIFEVKHHKALTTLVRLHSECLTGDLFGSTRCDCGAQFDESLRLLSEQGGVLLYLRQEGRGIGLYNKIDAYVLQDGGSDTFEANRRLGRRADERSYASAAIMLTALGITKIRLLTNNPDKVAQLQQMGIDVKEVLNTGVYRTPENVRYLEAKRAQAGHALTHGRVDA